MNNTALEMIGFAALKFYRTVLYYKARFPLKAVEFKQNYQWLDYALQHVGENMLTPNNNDFTRTIFTDLVLITYSNI